MLFRSTGGTNIAIGTQTLESNTTGQGNTAVGYHALDGNTIGNFNIALGESAGVSVTDGNSNIDIGNVGAAGDSGTIRIGAFQTRTFIAGISGVLVPGGTTVFVAGDGQLGTVVSSARFKDEIRPMDKTSEVLFGLKPVAFRYKKEIDPERIPQFGLVAEEVEKVNPDLIVRDKEGRPYTVRYDQVNAMLLNEFLKEHKAFVEEQREVREQRAMIAQQQKQIEAVTAGLQKVSAQLELHEPVSQIAINNQ